ncbi:MAG: M20 family metallopeptidase [Rhodospirillales bacterium]
MTLSAVDLAQQLIRFDTINPPGRERPCAEHLGRLLEDAGFEVTYHDFGDDRANLIARRGGTPDSLTLSFTGHLDTVPLGHRAWSVDPHAADISDGKLWGRGSSDMKSGVAAFTAAAIGLADHLEGTAGVELVYCAGEETGCDGSFDLARGAGRLGNCGALVVAEPSSNQPWVGHKGALWLRGTSQGVTAHGSMPEQGDNAIYKAARAIAKLEEFDFNVARHPVLGPTTMNVGMVEGGLNINSVPDHAEFTMDIRTVPGVDHAHLREQLTSFLGEEIEIETVVDVGGMWTDPETEWVQEVFHIVSDQTGWEKSVQSATYFTDASALTPAYGNPPTIVLGPGEAAMAHQTDEYCFVARIEEAAAIYQEIIRRWCHI